MPVVTHKSKEKKALSDLQLAGLWASERARFRAMGSSKEGGRLGSSQGMVNEREGKNIHPVHD